MLHKHSFGQKTHAVIGVEMRSDLLSRIPSELRKACEESLRLTTIQMHTHYANLFRERREGRNKFPTPSVNEPESERLVKRAKAQASDKAGMQQAGTRTKNKQPPVCNN